MATLNKPSFALIILLLFTVSIGGCTYKFGEPPKVKALASLTPLKSTKQDVLDLLGKPDGPGSLHHSSTYNVKRDVWLYRYMAVSSSGLGGPSIKMTYLQIFLNNDLYDGYLWFSSLTESE